MTKANAPQERRAATLVMACLGVFVAYLPVTTVSVSLPAIQRALDASTSQLSWVSDAFVLPMAALILTAGVFGDVHGRKKVYLAGLALSGLGSFVALCAQNIQTVWAGQALAGLGSAALLPTTLALISHAVPDPRERGKYIGLWATALSAALAVGPVIAGTVLDHFAWRWIYLLSVPVSLVAVGIGAKVLTDSRAPGSRRLDWPGQITAALAITALVYGIIEGGATSFTDVKVMVALFTAAVGAVAFVLVERHSPSPMLDLTLFRSPAFTATTLIAMISFLGLIGFFFALSLYLGMVQQLSTLDAAWRLLMVSLSTLVLGAPVGRLVHRVSPRVLIPGGLLISSAALLSLTDIGVDTSFGSLAWRLALLGLGMAFVITPMTAIAVSSVPFHQAGMAAAGNNAFRQVGAALGPAVLGTLLTAKAVDSLQGHLTDAGLTGQTVRQVTAVADHDGIGAVAGLDLGADMPRVLGAVSQAFLDGLHLCLIVSAVLTLFAAVLGALLLRRPQHASPVAEPRDAAAVTGPVAAGVPQQQEVASLAGNRVRE
ncbi:MFS transporter [Streptomyces sp. NBC_00576]|uniref:MFS transporter n=1 Tax=Streptomyces sp. NBC_00576 TaxID=2903665 RepID=UPI002E80AE19|nr:MFS transporter [Streptomyces sp. NBC_00576]WUB77591.1 MFS transporter [Streptomyces sp. NBC_00576]